MDLTALRDALDEVTAADPATFSDCASILELQQLLARMESVTVRAVGAFDANRVWHDDNAFSATVWLTNRCHISKHAALRQVKLARGVRHLPAFESSWSAGRITGDHVFAVEKVRRFETEDQLARDEEVLVEQAERLVFPHFARAVHYWEQHADPDGSERNAARQLRDRDVFLVSSLDGMWLGGMTLDPISGAIVSNELERLVEQLYQEDCAEAKVRLADILGGAEPNIALLARSPQQRRADALVRMATRSASMPADARRPRPLFTVLVGYETLHGRIVELSQGVAVTPGSLLPWLDEAYVERAVFGLGQRVEVSERARFFSGATRRALEVRDRGCQHPFCDASVDRCQADHIEPFSEGGLTVQENGRMLCGFHNRVRNQGARGENGWDLPPPGD